MTFSKKIKISAEKESDASYCGIVPSGDPRVFGPFTWETFHVMAQNYPQTPNQVTITQCQNFVNAIPYMIPCSQCGYHFQKFIEEYLSNNPRAFHSQSELIQFFVEAHNNVSKYTNPNREPWTVQDAAKKYTAMNTCFHNSGWGGPELCKSVDCSHKVPKGGNVRGFK